MRGWCIRRGFKKQGIGIRFCALHELAQWLCGGLVRRLTVALLMLYAFAVPWEYSLDLGEPLGNAARILGIFLLIMAGLLVLMRRGVRRPGAVQWLVLALYLYFVCSYFWTVEQDATVDKIRAYFQVMMIVWIVWEVAEAPEDLRELFRAFVAGCWVLAILTFLNFASASSAAEQLAGQVRFVAEGQDPNDVARFLDLGFPLAALLFATEKHWLARSLAIGYIPAGLLAVLLTASRGGFSGALAALLGSAILLVMWRPRASSVVFVGLAVTVVAIFLFVPAGSLDRLATIPEEVGGGDLNDRLNIWDAGWHAFTRSPWWGYGAGTFTTAAGLASGDTAHNTVMAVLVTGGLAGTAIFTGILAGVVRAVSRTGGLLRVALGTGMVVWLITSMVGSVEENRATWLVFAMVTLAGRLAEERREAMMELFSGEGRREATMPVYAGSRLTVASRPGG
jgi:O-antigen ligase